METPAASRSAVSGQRQNPVISCSSHLAPLLAFPFGGRPRKPLSMKLFIIAYRQTGASQEADSLSKELLDWKVPSVEEPLATSDSAVRAHWPIRIKCGGCDARAHDSGTRAQFHGNRPLGLETLFHSCLSRYSPGSRCGFRRVLTQRESVFFCSVVVQRSCPRQNRPTNTPNNRSSETCYLS